MSPTACRGCPNNIEVSEPNEDIEPYVDSVNFMMKKILLKNKGYNVAFDGLNGFEQDFSFAIEMELERLSIEKEKKRIDRMKKTDR
jgi:hypothetical protein